MCTPVPWLLLLSLQLIVEISSSGTHDSQDSEDEDDSDDTDEDETYVVVDLYRNTVRLRGNAERERLVTQMRI